MSAQAGLFSAVLTAFVVISVTMLQQDNTQTTATAVLQISAQLSNHSLPPVIVEPFEPATSSVTINCLWFLSLVLSLTSALFGMIAKQWLREYMEWTTASLTSQNAITLRQKRYEAFVGWKVPAVVAAIPALLEVSLILFFAGMVVYLRTVNAVVAGVTTAGIALVIGLAVLATILPVFWQRCPYRTPLGWACMRTAWLLAWLWNDVIRWTQSRLGSSYRVRRLLRRAELHVPRYKTWRDRDMKSIQTRDPVWKEISEALTGGKEVYIMDSHRTYKFGRWDHDLVYLDRALLWIHSTSQNERLLADVVHCAVTREIPQNDSFTKQEDTFAFLAADFALACRVLDRTPAELSAELDQWYVITLAANQSVEHAALIGVDGFARKNLSSVLVSHVAELLLRHLLALFPDEDNRLYDLRPLTEASTRFLMRITTSTLR